MIKAGAVMALGAALLAGFWLGRWTGGGTDAPAPVATAPVAATLPATPRVCPPPQQVLLPGQPLPTIADATPAEIAALRQAEASHSQSHPPVATYRGPDGRQHAFKYEASPVEALQERSREAREKQLMEELEADPAAFARRYNLRAREVERILDGSLPMPPELLD